MVQPIHRKGNPWRFRKGQNTDTTGVKRRPYIPPTLKRQKYVQRRTGLTPEQQADWVLGRGDVARLVHKSGDLVHDWFTKGRRRQSELSFHKLPSEDYGIGDECRFYTRMQDLLGFAIDWKIPLYVLTEPDEQMLQRGRVAFILTRGYDPVPLLSITRNNQESEASE